MRARSLVVAVVAFGAALWAAPAALADGSVECTAVLGGPQPNVIVPSGAECRLENATVNGNVWVQEDAGLIVAGSTINGNIRGDGARFFGLTDDDDSPATTVVNGSVEFVGTQSSPLGSTRTTQPATHNFVCDRTRITSNFSVRASDSDAPVLFGSAMGFGFMSVPVAECEDFGSQGGNVVDQNYEAIANEGEVRHRHNSIGNGLSVIANQGSGGKDVFNNSAGGDLLCLDNDPAPASGGNSDNRPEDHPEEQCQG